MATSTRLMHARDGLSGVTIRARSAPPPLWQVNTSMLAAWTELCMHSHNCARAILAKLISIRRGGGGVEGMGGPLWPPALKVVKPCGGYTQGTTGSWMRISGPLWNPVRGTGMPGFASVNAYRATARVAPTRYAAFLVLCLILSLLSACGGINRPVTVHTTLTPATAAGEPVLPHS